MSRHLSFVFMSAMFAGGLSVALASSALAATCDVNACISFCQKQNPQGGSGRVCASGCMIKIEGLKKKGQCK